MKREIEILLRRAEGFLKDAIEDMKRNEYDLAMFHIEQACQLILKAKLLDLVGYHDRTHSLRKLLGDLSTFFKKDEIEEFLRKNWNTLRNLEFAYVASRYFPEEFRKEEVEEAVEFYRRLKDILWSL